MILLAHSFFLNHDAKQLSKMKPYSPLSTLILASLLRTNGHEVALFDATFASGVEDFKAALDEHRPHSVVVMEDNFNFLTKMCTTLRRPGFTEAEDACSNKGLITKTSPRAAAQVTSTILRWHSTTCSALRRPSLRVPGSTRRAPFDSPASSR